MKVKNSYTATLSSKGQITVPIQVRKLLNIKEKDSVEFSISYDQQVLFQAQRFTLKDSFGAVPKIDKTFSEQRKISKKNRLEKYK